MNLKTRIKKLENQFAGADPNFCSCDRAGEYHLLVPALDYPDNNFCETCNGECTFDPDAVCGNCGKPVLSEIIKPEPENEFEVTK